MLKATVHEGTPPAPDFNDKVLTFQDDNHEEFLILQVGVPQSEFEREVLSTDIKSSRAQNVTLSRSICMKIAAHCNVVRAKIDDPEFNNFLDGHEPDEEFHSLADALTGSHGQTILGDDDGA